MAFQEYMYINMCVYIYMHIHIEYSYHIYTCMYVYIYIYIRIYNRALKSASADASSQFNVLELNRDNLCWQSARISHTRELLKDVAWARATGKEALVT